MIRAALIFKRLVFFKEAIGVIAFYGMFAIAPANTDLEVRWSISPFFIAEQGNDLQRRMNEDADGTEIMFITLRNRSDTAISIQDLRIAGVKGIYKLGIRSSAEYLNTTSAKLMETKRVESDTFAFPGIKEIPAGHNVQLQFSATLFMMLLHKDRVTVTSSAKKTLISQSGEVGGIALFFDRHSSTIGAMAMTGLVLLGIRRLRKSESTPK